ncbi:MAG TPA: hypothetical protein VNV64_04195 [Candidatus Binatia bacterium]|nr:hypothetical protein [Candidatus Binatia bacterium]
MSAQAKEISVTKLAPEFIRKDFPRTWYHAKSRLLTWYPRGVLNEAFADQVVKFIEMEERIQEAPFDRYLDLSGLTHIRIGIDHIIFTARRRRTAKQPVKTALFADNPMSFSVAHSYELLMYHAMIEVRAFNERTAAANWLEVPLKTLECPSLKMARFNSP